MALTVQLIERDQKVERLVKEQRAQLATKEQQVEIAKKSLENRLADKEAQIKNMELAQKISNKRLQQAEAIVNEFLVDPLVGTSFQESANEAKIKVLTRQVEQDRLMKATMVAGWITQQEIRKTQIQEHEEEVKKLNKELEDKEVQLQARVVLPPEEPPASEPSHFEPLEADIPSSSFDTTGMSKDIPLDYTVSRYTTTDPRETNLERELKEKMQQEVDAIVKECMHWESRIIHSACMVYLALEDIQADYHMPTLPYLLLKQEVQLMKKRFLPKCSTNKLGGYAQVPIQYYQVVDIEQHQPTWRTTWMQKNLKKQITLFGSTPRTTH